MIIEKLLNSIFWAVVISFSFMCAIMTSLGPLICCILRWIQDIGDIKFKLERSVAEHKTVVPLEDRIETA